MGGRFFGAAAVSRHLEEGIMGGWGTYSLWLSLALVIAVAIVLAVGTIRLADRILSDSVNQENNSALSPFLTCVALVFGALIGFTVVVAWSQFSSASEHVTNEASTLTTLYRQTAAMDAPEQTQLRKLLRTYTNAVKGPEWDRQREDGGTSLTARAAITDMYHVLGSQPANDASIANGEFFSQLTVLTTERNTRILDAQPRIPGLLWGGLIFGAFVLITIMGFMRLESKHGHALLSSAVAALLGGLLFIVFCLDHPFSSQLGITAEPYAHSLEVFDAVDRGT
jgi:heme exporter protein D